MKASSLFILCASLFGSCLSALAAEAEPYVAVAPVRGERFQHLSWPKITRAQDGTLVLAYIAGTTHWVGGSPAISFSTDDGKTFSAPMVLKEFGSENPKLHCGNLALGHAADGSLLLLAMAYKKNETNNIFGWRSTDNGRTWEATDTSQLGPEKTGSVFGNIFPIPHKGVFATGHFLPLKDKPNSGVWFSMSQDEGRRWGTPQLITRKHAVEPVFILADGMLVGLVRNLAKDNEDGRPFQAVSRDLGQTWDVALCDLRSSDPANYDLAGPFLIEDPRSKGRLIALTTERRIRGKNERPLARIWLWTAQTSDLKWKRERVVLEVPVAGDAAADGDIDFGYPWMVPLQDEGWLMVYYQGLRRGAASIRAVELEMAP